VEDVVLHVQCPLRRIDQQDPGDKRVNPGGKEVKARVPGWLSSWGWIVLHRRVSSGWGSAVVEVRGVLSGRLAHPLKTNIIKIKNNIFRMLRHPFSILLTRRPVG
jgi:hypothetical protein